MSKASQTPFKPIERIALGNRLLRLPDVESKTGNVSADVKLTHPSEVKLTHLG